MKRMSLYCKAYLLRELRGHSHWTAPVSLADDTVVYLHDDYKVTMSVYADCEVLFDSVTPEWQQYCRETLGFDPESVMLPGQA